MNIQLIVAALSVIAPGIKSTSPLRNASCETRNYRIDENTGSVILPNGSNWNSCDVSNCVLACGGTPASMLVLILAVPALNCVFALWTSEQNGISYVLVFLHSPSATSGSNTRLFILCDGMVGKEISEPLRLLSFLQKPTACWTIKLRSVY